MNVPNVDTTAKSYDLMTLAENADLALSGNTGAQVAALLIETAHDEREQTQLAQQGEEMRLRQLEQEQVDALMREADAVRTAGQIRGATMMASGVLQIGGAAAGLGTEGSDGANVANILGGQAKAVEGAGNMLAAEYDYAAKAASADGTRAGNAASHSKRRLEELAAAESDAGQLARDALRAASDFVRSESESDRATIYLRA